MGQVPSTVRETASPNGPCVIRRPAVTASSTIVRKGVAGITQDWTGGAHACSFPDGGWHLPHLRYMYGCIESYFLQIENPSFHHIAYCASSSIRFASLRA